MPAWIDWIGDVVRGFGGIPKGAERVAEEVRGEGARVLEATLPYVGLTPRRPLDHLTRQLERIEEYVAAA